MAGDVGRTGLDRCIQKRLSDRRSPGRNPGPQDAFEVSMISVSCNSHQFSQPTAYRTGERHNSGVAALAQTTRFKSH